MGLVLLCIIWLITFASSYFFVARDWWPHAISASAPYIDHQFHVTFIAMGIVFLAAQIGLGWFVWRYRASANHPVRYSHGNTRLEIIWTALTALLFVGLNLVGSPIWAAERFRSAEAGAVPIEVTAMQFAWYFRYPGRDGKFARTDPKLEDASAGGEAALGVDTSDPAAKDDIVTGRLVVPVNRDIDLSLRAHDVIHSFFIPQMRFKQDAVPGLNIHMHIRPLTIGEYEIACAELCGLGHYKMHGIMQVVSEADYEKWLAAREADKQ